jgi:AraC-like DNA-binding protein
MKQANARPSSGEGAQSVWAGRVYVGVGRALYVGAASDTSPHAHHAIQICVAVEGSFRLRPGPESPWRRHRGVVIRSDQRHQLDGSGCEVVIVYLEPESQEGRRLAVGRPGGPIQAVPPAAVRAIRAATAAAASREVDSEAALRLCRDILAQLGVRLERSGAPDDRVRRALVAIRADPTRRWKVAELAEAARLSSRRFREVFSSQVGMSCRQYLLWTRLNSALRQLASGASLTEVALAAGFADAAHLTRTFRRMVGIVPSAIARSVCFVEGLV